MKWAQITPYYELIQELDLGALAQEAYEIAQYREIANSLIELVFDGVGEFLDLLLVGPPPAPAPAPAPPAPAPAPAPNPAPGPAPTC